MWSYLQEAPTLSSTSLTLTAFTDNFKYFAFIGIAPSRFAQASIFLVMHSGKHDNTPADTIRKYLQAWNKVIPALLTGLMCRGDVFECYFCLICGLQNHFLSQRSDLPLIFWGIFDHKRRKYLLHLFEQFPLFLFCIFCFVLDKYMYFYIYMCKSKTTQCPPPVTPSVVEQTSFGR